MDEGSKRILASTTVEAQSSIPPHVKSTLPSSSALPSLISAENLPPSPVTPSHSEPNSSLAISTSDPNPSFNLKDETLARIKATESIGGDDKGMKMCLLQDVLATQKSILATQQAMLELLK